MAKDPRYIEVTRTVKYKARTEWPEYYQGITYEEALDYERNLPKVDILEMMFRLPDEKIEITTEVIEVNNG